MAKARTIEEGTPKSLLPLPEAWVSHHLQTLSGPMREWKTQGRVPPVLLLTGVAGLGKREICHYLAQWIFCERHGFGEIRGSPSDSEADASLDLFGGIGASPDGMSSSTESTTVNTPQKFESSPCGECTACHRALHGTWVDFSEIRNEDEEDSGALKIEQFRKLKSTIGFGSHEGSYRIILIPDADRMTAQAANSVLKLLEEPPRGWVFLLTASDPTLILSTVLSRCQTLRLRPFSEIELEQSLRADGAEAGRARMAARLAQGSWMKSRALLQDETWERRRLIVQFLKSPASVFGDVVDWAAQEASHLEFLLDTLENLVADLVLKSVSGEGVHAWRNADAASELQHHSQMATRKFGGSFSHARDFWSDRAQAICETRRRMSAPLNRKILVQDLLMPWLRLDSEARSS
jgi:hypothetical protein